MANRTGTEVGFDPTVDTSEAITVPAATEAIIVFWGGFDSATSSIDTMTLDGDGFTILESDYTAQIYIGCAILENPSTGAQTLSWTKTEVNNEGIGLIVFVENIAAVTPLRDSAFDSWNGQVSGNATVNSNTDDLVIGAVIGSTGGTSPDGSGAGQTVYLNNDASGTAYEIDGVEMDSPGASTTQMDGAAYWGGVVTVSIANAAGGGPSGIGLSQLGTYGMNVMAGGFR